MSEYFSSFQNNDNDEKVEYICGSKWFFIL